MGSEFTTLMLAGLAAAALHASLPTHWLPFVLAARAQNWSLRKTLAVNLAAGGGHVVFTAFLGFLLVAIGMQVPHHMEEWLTLAAGTALIALGAYAIWRDWRGRDPHIFGHHHDAHCHHDLPGIGAAQTQPDSGHADYPLTSSSGDGAALARTTIASAPASAIRTQGLTIAGLFALVSLSPCEAFLPIYVAGATAGWTGFFLLTGVLTAGTITGMLLLTWLTFHSAERLKFAFVERHEGAVIGVVLILLGIFVLAAAH